MNDIRLKDAQKILRKNNFVFDYIRGDHYYWVSPAGQRLTLVFHMKRQNSCPGAIWAKAVKQHNLKV